MPNTLKTLWNGDFPLSQAFWHYAIAYGTIANILAQAAAIAAVLAGLPVAVAIGLHYCGRPRDVDARAGRDFNADFQRQWLASQKRQSRASPPCRNMAMAS